MQFLVLQQYHIPGKYFQRLNGLIDGRGGGQNILLNTSDPLANCSLWHLIVLDDSTTVKSRKG